MRYKSITLDQIAQWERDQREYRLMRDEVFGDELPRPLSRAERDRDYVQWLYEDGQAWQRRAVKDYFERAVVLLWKYRPGTWRDTGMALSGLALFLSRMDKRLADDADCLAGMAFKLDEEA